MKIRVIKVSKNLFAGVVLASLVFATAGCKNPLPAHATALARSPDNPPRMAVLQDTVVGSSLSGYRRRLNAGTHWILVGHIPEGNVWSPMDTVLTAEARHVHEANMVVANNIWVGFYLVVERSYSPLRQPVPVHLTEEGKP